MRKKELIIKIDYISIVFGNMNAETVIRKLLQLPLEYFQIQPAKVKHMDYTNLYQFGTIKVYGDKWLKDGTREEGCYLILSGQGCDDYYSFLQTGNSTYHDFFAYCVQMLGEDGFHLTRLDIAIDDRNDIPYFTVEQIKNKCLRDEFVSKSKSYRFAESSFNETTAKTVYIGDGKSNLSYRFYDKDKEQAGKYNLPYEELGNWKRTELQLRDEMAHSFAMLLCETLEELGKLAFDLLSTSLRFVTKDESQQNRSRWKTSRFWERYLGAIEPLALAIDKPNSSLYETQNWLCDGGALSAMKAFLFLDKHKALGGLKDVKEMMRITGYSPTLRQKIVSHLYRIDREELIPLVCGNEKGSVAK